MVRVPEAKSDCSRQGEAKVRKFNFETHGKSSRYQVRIPRYQVRIPRYQVRILSQRQNQDMYSEIHHLPRVGPKQLCALAALG